MRGLILFYFVFLLLFASMSYGDSSIFIIHDKIFFGKLQGISQDDITNIFNHIFLITSHTLT